MITCKTDINEKVNFELNKKPLIINSCLLGLGILVIITYLFLPENFWTYLLLFSGSLLFVAGIIGLFTIKKLLKTAKQNASSVMCTFSADFYTAAEFKKGEKVAEQKVYYKDILKFTETPNYFFLYQNKTMAMPVAKNSVSADHTRMLSKIFVARITNKDKHNSTTVYSNNNFAEKENTIQYKDDEKK